jgi:hypothetical protein
MTIIENGSFLAERRISAGARGAGVKDAARREANRVYSAGTAKNVPMRPAELNRVNGE